MLVFIRSTIVLVAFTSVARAQLPFWQGGNFAEPGPYPGGFALLDDGERYGDWRVVGQAGNVTWVDGAYQHNGFSFPGPFGTKEKWVNLAAISRTATGIMHYPVPTTEGQSYTLTFYVGNMVDPSGLYGVSSTVNVYQNSTFLQAATNSDGAGSNTETWKAFSIIFTATAPYTTIAFINGDPSNDMDCGIADTLLAPTSQTSAGRRNRP